MAAVEAAEPAVEAAERYFLAVAGADHPDGTLNAAEAGPEPRSSRLTVAKRGRTYYRRSLILPAGGRQNLSGDGHHGYGM